MKKIALFSLALLALACSKDESSNGDPSRMTLSIDRSALNERVALKNTPVASNKTQTVTFNLIADVAAPILNGQQYYATSAEFYGNYVYVTYHIPGETYGGVLDVFDVTDPYHPQIVSELQIVDTDLHTVDIHSANTLWLSGARDIYSNNYQDNLPSHKGAVVLELGLANGALTTAAVEAPLPSYATNSVRLVGSDLFAIAGDSDGGMYKLSTGTLNTFYTTTASDTFQNAEFMDAANGTLIALEGGQNNQVVVRKYSNTADLSQVTTTTLPYNSTKVGKNVVRMKNGMAYMALGADGLVAMDVTSNAYTQYAQSGTSSGVDADDEFVYVANSSGGLAIFDHTNNMSAEGVYNYSGSANYVSTNGSYIFLANGDGGLKILYKVGSVDPYCSNLSYVASNSNININNSVALSSLGIYQEANGDQFYRWKVENKYAAAKTFTWTIGSLSGSMTVPGGGEAYFSTLIGGTLILAENGTQMASASSNSTVNDLTNCSGAPVASCDPSWNTIQSNVWVNVNGGQMFQLNANGATVNQINVNSNGYIELCGILYTNYDVNNNATYIHTGELHTRSFHLNSGSTTTIDGTLTTTNNLAINAVYNHQGDIEVFGDLYLNSGANFTINGSLIVHGNMAINGTLNFVGNGNTVQVFGNVWHNSGGIVNGSYTGTTL